MRRRAQIDQDTLSIPRRTLYRSRAFRRSSLFFFSTILILFFFTMAIIAHFTAHRASSEAQVSSFPSSRTPQLRGRPRVPAGGSGAHVRPGENGGDSQHGQIGGWEIPGANGGEEVREMFAMVAGTRVDDKRRVVVGNRERFECPGRPGEWLGFDRINDEYCDCTESGFDEPGTSACAGAGEAEFYCGEEDGKRIPSSRVEDGVCDCCDGRDEGRNQRKCKNRCRK